MMWKKKNIGLTLIELMVALVISSILIAALYRSFIGQQKTYTLQEQVVDTQQNVRVAIIKMVRDIRMTGFGNVGSLLPAIKDAGMIASAQVIDLKPNEITIVGAFRQIMHSTGEPISIISHSPSEIVLNYATDQFDGDPNKYICIGGVESRIVMARDGTKLTLNEDLKFSYQQGTPIFKIQAITYSIGDSGGKSCLLRNENTGGGAQPVADNIESLQFRYFDKDGYSTATAADIRMVQVTVTSMTDVPDPEYYGKVDHKRRRTITSNIYTRNMGISI